MVLIVTSIVMVFVTVILAMTLMNNKMKKASLHSASTFYDAESAMEEIRAGLSQEVSSAASDAYLQTLLTYGDSSANGETSSQRSDYFNTIYQKDLRKALASSTSSSDHIYYDIDTLTGYLKETAYDSAAQTGAQIVTRAGNNGLNIITTGDDAGSVILKDVEVRYIDANGYQSQITTDIHLASPNLDFSAASTINNLLFYSFIASDHTSVEQNLNLTGNAFLGYNDSTIQSGRKLQISPLSSGTPSNLLSAGNLVLSSGDATLDAGDSQLWMNSIELEDGSNTLSLDGGSLFLQNDILMGSSSTVTLSGSLLGFGNAGLAQTSTAASEQSDFADAIAASPADYSSSVIVNGKNSKLDLSGLSTMLLAGNSYINASSSVSDSTGTLSQNGILTGQSIAVKSDQRAYLVPAELIAPDSSYGRTNPMTAAQYGKLLADLRSRYGYATDYEASTHLADLDTQVSVYGATLRQLGVTGTQVAGISTASGSMIYVFLKFGDETSAANFYTRYASQLANYSRIRSNLISFYTSGGLDLPKNVLSDTGRFYFNGDLITDDASAIVVPASLVSASAAETKSAQTQTVTLQDRYYALCRALKTDYDTLSQEERAFDATIFDSIIDRDTLSSEVPSTQMFVSATGEGAVVSDSSSITLSTLSRKITNTEDVNGDRHSDAKIHLIITTGDVTVDESFDGLIIAGGTVTITSAGTISADPVSASLAINSAQTKSDGSILSVRDFFLNADAFTVGGLSTEEDEDTGAISVPSLVTYQNWSHQ